MIDGEARRTPVRLTRKYAERIDGVDLSHHKVGDLMDLPVRDARMLILEGWATPLEAADSSADRAPEPGPPDPTRQKT